MQPRGGTPVGTTLQPYDGTPELSNNYSLGTFWRVYQKSWTSLRR